MTVITASRKQSLFQKHWIHLILRALRLHFFQDVSTSQLVTESYDTIATSYDDTWTTHMRDKSIALIDRLNLTIIESALDLCCGTGFITHILSKHSIEKPIGVDQSQGMLSIARKQYFNSCEFKHSDVINYLRDQQDKKFDVVTCFWALGYSKPFQIIKGAYNILKPNGTFAVIDNTLWSIKETIWPVIVTAAEDPTMFHSMFNIRFLPTIGSLKRRLSLAGFQHINVWDGNKTYWVKNGNEAVKRLHDTGAFAGLERCIYPHRKEEFNKRFISNLEEMYHTEKGIPITHRYIAAIAKKGK